MFSRENQLREREETEMEDDLGELAHLMMEAQKSHNRLSASQRTREPEWLSPSLKASEAGNPMG